MEIINFDNLTFKEMLERFDFFTKKVKLLCEKYKDKRMSAWLDGEDVCLILNISSRTLQTYRDTGKISYSQINHKMYYKSSDIEKFIEKNSNNFNQNYKSK